MRLILLLLGIVICSCSSPHSGEFSWTRVEQEDSTARAVISLEYPISSSPDVMPFSDSLGRFVQATVARFQKQAVEVNQVWGALDDRSITGNLDVITDSLFSSDALVSCTIGTTRYFAGDAHPYRTYTALTFDRRKGVLLRPSQFLATADSTIRRLIADTLAARGCCFDPETLSSIGIDELAISITQDKVLFSFADYQIASYACAPGRVLLSKSMIHVRVP